MLLQLHQFFLGVPLHPVPQDTPAILPPPPAYFMSMGHSYKFFCFSISYTILNFLVFCTYRFMLLNPCTFSPILLLPPPTW